VRKTIAPPRRRVSAEPNRNCPFGDTIYLIMSIGVLLVSYIFIIVKLGVFAKIKNPLYSPRTILVFSLAANSLNLLS
jgi:hypothetical protein